MATEVLEVKDLSKNFPIYHGFFKKEVGRVRAVDKVSFTIGKGTPFVVVGVNSLTVPVGGTVGAHAIVSGEGTAAATGMVQFTCDGTPCGPSTALQTGGLFGSQAQASVLLSGLAAGTHVAPALALAWSRFDRTKLAGSAICGPAPPAPSPRRELPVGSRTESRGATAIGASLSPTSWYR